jgi:hypothetical protein
VIIAIRGLKDLRDVLLARQADPKDTGIHAK